jgi:hypothetical protein
MEHAEHSSVPSDDWAGRATEWVEHLVELVRDRSVRPVLFAVKALVVGVIVALVGIFLLVAGSIGIVRLLTEDAFGGRVWASDLLLGGIFAAAGAFLLKLGSTRRRHDGDK